MPGARPADVGVVGGDLVTPSGRGRLNIYAIDGRISSITPELLDADEVFDASGLLVMPGMIDAHVHFMDPADPSREDFPRGTAAAVRAGVTTVIEHTHARPVITAEDLRGKSKYLEGRSRIDFALGAHAWPDRLDEVASVWRAGAAFIKVFTCTTHGVPGFSSGALRRLFERVAAVNALCLVHCEDEVLTSDSEQELRGSGRSDGGVIPEWRNRDAELTALSTVAILARAHDARVVAAHVSHAAALNAAAGLTIESCPQYLSLFEREVLDHGSLRKFTPPARARSQGDLDAMWKALAEYRIDYVSSDHAPSTREQKAAGSIWDVHFGLPGVDTTLSVLLDGASRGLISYERVVEVYAERPSKIYGLWPAKGQVSLGADADFILVDPGAHWPVRGQDILSKAGWSPFEGRTLTGRTVRTYCRGKLAMADGEVIAEAGAGRFLPRGLLLAAA